MPPIDLLKTYSRTRGLICVADAARPLPVGEFNNLFFDKSLMGGPSLLFVINSNSENDGVDVPGAILIPPPGDESFETIVGPHMLNLLK